MTPPREALQIHNVEPAAVFPLLATRGEGLTEEEVRVRRQELGANQIDVAGGLRWPRLLARHFVNFFSLLLDFSAALCFVAEWLQPGESMALLGAALLAVAIINGLFAFAQEYRAERAMEELKKFLPKTIRVRRAGQARCVLAGELVPGDVLLLEEGEQVPADARLVECDGVLVSNSPLTGESRPLSLTAAAVAAPRLIDAANVVFAGCAVLRGRGEAVVFGTGKRTEFGKIAMLSQQVERPASPLEREVNRLSRVLTVIATAMGVSFFVYGAATGRPLLMNLVFMMGIIVANVPEGLLPTLTLALSMGSLRMARKQVLVKSLEAVEALGAMHVICTDKTGTLTTDRLALAHARGAYSRVADAACDGQLRRGATSSSPHDIATLAGPALRELLHYALIASDVRSSDRGTWTGDPLDVAIANCYAREGGDVAELLAGIRRRFPFDVHKRRQAGWFERNGANVFAVKGAWEALREVVTSVREPGTGAAAESADAGGVGRGGVGPELARLDQEVQAMASEGYRVIAVAIAHPRGDTDRAAPTDETQARLESRLELVGFLAWEDPVRPEAPAALERCRRAGIRVIMITGDHPDTATAIARRIGLVSPDVPASACALRGDELEKLREVELQARLRAGVVIFARTTPEQKLKIITALMQSDHVVGMTGDGVNDAPALKAADIGIAMGVGGTDVAREAADIILLDNNFASIVAGVEEGRAIFRNIQRFTDYVLASNVPEIFPYLLYIVFPVPLALTILQILAVDLGTDIVPAIGLGQERPEPDLMEQPPRRRDERLLSPTVFRHAYLFYGPLEALVSLSLFFLVLTWGGWRYGQALSPQDPLYLSATGITLASVVLLQIGNLFGRRSVRHSGLDRGVLRNGVLLAGLALEIVFLAALLLWQPLQRVLGTGPVPWPAVGLAILAVPVVFLLDYAFKRYQGQPPADRPNGSSAASPRA